MPNNESQPLSKTELSFTPLGHLDDSAGKASQDKYKQALQQLGEFYANSQKHIPNRLDVLATSSTKHDS